MHPKNSSYPPKNTREGLLMNRVDEAFCKADRRNFVVPAYRDSAFVDAPLPIGQGQTISQPTTVRMMLDWLDVRPGQKILDVGSGSGWTTALLSYLVGPRGHVYAVERVPELVEFGQRNVERLGIKNASFHQAGDEFGLPDYTPYDRILVSAAANKVPQELKDQLKEGGKMVIPVHNDILEVTKQLDGKWDIKRHPGFVFVPLL
ncbi:MAG: protein-L-isoaspartate(D-aspartate) O-methyltransferase [Candidatus Saccharimonadales bacterium]